MPRLKIAKGASPPRAFAGQVNAGDLLTRLLHGVVVTGIAPRSFYAGPPEPFDGLPVDFVAAALSAIALDPRAGLATYHFVPEAAPSLDAWVDGIVSARRFAPTDGNGPFIAIYELDCDDLDVVVQRLGELGASGRISSLELLNMDPPPIPKIFRQISSYTK